ncbi:MAG: hypothetical protein CM1200mP33_6700 [Chloroflexota bacterium]|nr:MAG: hypothetical protein CM1200mP33_6700 [Chloroflexota bacterium]
MLKGELMNDSFRFFTDKTILINLSKGLEKKTLKTMSEVILEVLGLVKKISFHFMGQAMLKK